MVNTENKENALNVRFSNVLLTWYNLTDEKSLNQTLQQILDISLSVQNPNIQPGVFLAEIRGHVRHGHTN